MIDNRSSSTIAPIPTYSCLGADRDRIWIRSSRLSCNPIELQSDREAIETCVLGT